MFRVPEMPYQRVISIHIIIVFAVTGILIKNPSPAIKHGIRFPSRDIFTFDINVTSHASFVSCFTVHDKIERHENRKMSSCVNE
jgi:hypothetical protein